MDMESCRRPRGSHGGDYKIGPGTLYDNLKTLIAHALVSEVRDRRCRRGDTTAVSADAEWRGGAGR